MGSKKCSKCGEEKEFSEFYKRKDCKDGLRSHCKSCVNLKQKEYNNKNKEKISHDKRKYHEDNKEKINLYQKQYRENNPDKVKESYKTHYENNKEKIHKKHKEYICNNKEKVSIRDKKYYEKNKERISKVCTEYKYSNAIYKRFFNKLTIDESPRLADDDVSIEVLCKYCGKYFTPTNIGIGRRIQALNGTMEGDSFLYCSQGCKDSCPVYNQKKYPKGFKKATSREVDPLVRQMCFERDDWKCQICGATQIEVPLHCHHVEGYTQNPVLGNDVTNTITLCKTCHKEVHKQPGCKYHELRCDS